MTRKLSGSHYVDNWNSDFITSAYFYNNHFELFCGYRLVLFITTVFRLYSWYIISCISVYLDNCWLSLINFRDMLNEIDKEIKCVSLKNTKLKSVKMQNFRKIATLRCHEICEPENWEINVSRKFHVIRYLKVFPVEINQYGYCWNKSYFLVVNCFGLRPLPWQHLI